MVGAAKWGDANQHRAALGPGKNLLGKLLVEVREEIKASHPDTKLTEQAKLISER